MKKNLPAFLTGALSTGLVISLCAGALAVSGTVSFNTSELALFGQTVVESGHSITATNGQQVPSSITYTDTAGGGTVYLPVRTISDLLDADIFYEDGIVYLGGLGGKPSTTMTTSEGTILVNGIEYLESEGAAPFSEVDPQTPSADVQVVTLQSPAQYQSSGPFYTVLTCPAEQGNRVTITLTDNRTEGPDLLVTVSRLKTVGQDCAFTGETLAPGETLTLTYQIANDADRLNGKLALQVMFNEQTAVDEFMDITVEAVQFQA